MDYHQIDIIKGKAIFYKYKGSKFDISRDLGDEYKKCYIPQEIEDEWKKDIINNLKAEIKHKSGNLRIVAISAFIQINSADEAIKMLLEVLKCDNLDTFSAIIICESLKKFIDINRRFLINEEQIYNIKLVLENEKKKMLSSKIYIDNSFMILPYMNDYDFSEQNIVNRIQNI
ncbi:MAG: hypothetical protein J6B04_00800 [Clostridia bacterium]|nr:hypothetical protein [Clostridia bacterium]